MKLTFDRLNELLRYEPETGKLFWRQSKNQVIAGSEAGSINKDGYFQICVDGKNYRAHRVVWFLHYQEIPTLQIDHINGVRTDNRVVNLRQVTQTQNLQNQKKARIDNKSGYLGVSLKGKKWRAQINVDGIKKHLGYFDTPKQAHDAYLKAKRTLHETCTI